MTSTPESPTLSQLLAALRFYHQDPSDPGRPFVPTKRSSETFLHALLELPEDARAREELRTMDPDKSVDDLLVQARAQVGFIHHNPAKTVYSKASRNQEYSPVTENDLELIWQMVERFEGVIKDRTRQTALSSAEENMVRHLPPRFELEPEQGPLTTSADTDYDAVFRKVEEIMAFPENTLKSGYKTEDIVSGRYYALYMCVQLSRKNTPWERIGDQVGYRASTLKKAVDTITSKLISGEKDAFQTLQEITIAVKDEGISVRKELEAALKGYAVPAVKGEFLSPKRSIQR